MSRGCDFCDVRLTVCSAAGSALLQRTEEALSASAGREGGSWVLRLGMQGLCKRAGNPGVASSP